LPTYADETFVNLKGLGKEVDMRNMTASIRMKSRLRLVISMERR
jgi:hypothetical protein